MPDDAAASRVRVLWLAKGLGPGGMEQLLVNHAAVGDREHIDYLAAYVVQRPNSIVPRLEAQGVRCHHLGGDDPRDPSWVRRLLALIRRERIDVVHVHSPFPAALARPAIRAMRHRPGLVYTEHNSADCYGTATRVSNLVTYPLDDARFAVSSAARDATPRVLRRHTEVLVHGVDVEGIARQREHREDSRAELGVGADELLVGIVANLRVAKAYPTMLRAAALVLERCPRARFVSLGHGPLEAELCALRDELGLGDRFRFMGHVPDAPGLMAAFDVMALSSDVEGLPVSVMEAKALALPVVATRVGGLPEMIVDGVDGLLVPSGEPASLADALVRILDDDTLRRSMAGASGASAVAFDAAVAVHRADQLYLELAGTRR